MFLDYVSQTVEMFKECPQPTNIEKHDPEAFEEWLSMARKYKSSGEIQQFITEDEEWDAWIEYALKTIEEGVSFNAED